MSGTSPQHQFETILGGQALGAEKMKRCNCMNRLNEWDKSPASVRDNSRRASPRC
jgi:hypothetical protein